MIAMDMSMLSAYGAVFAAGMAIGFLISLVVVGLHFRREGDVNGDR